MKFSVLLTVFVALISPDALAEIILTPKSITFVCSTDVEPGTVVFTDPPKFSCDDYAQIESIVGLGITIGPNTDIVKILDAIEQTNRKIRTTSNSVPIIRAPEGPVKVRPEGWVDQEDVRPLKLSDDISAWLPIVQNDYSNFDGFSRNKSFFRD